VFSDFSLFNDFLELKTDVNVPTESNRQNKLEKNLVSRKLLTKRVDPDPDLKFKCTDPRRILIRTCTKMLRIMIRICTKMLRIRNTGGFVIKIPISLGPNQHFGSRSRATWIWFSQKHTDTTDPDSDSDSDPQHWFLNKLFSHTFAFEFSCFALELKTSGTAFFP
jgi:hypothetical protein